MRQNDRTDPAKSKKVARIRYASRQIDKFIKWSIETRGRLLYKELIELHEVHNIKCYGKNNIK
jgi:hypothetical protein